MAITVSNASILITTLLLAQGGGRQGHRTASLVRHAGSALSRGDLKAASTSLDEVIHTGRNAEPTLLDVLKRSPNRFERQAAALCIGRINTSLGRSALRQLLWNGDDFAVSLEAISALSRAKDRSAVPEIAWTAQFGTVELRISAITALTRIGGPESGSALVRLLSGARYLLPLDLRKMPLVGDPVRTYKAIVHGVVALNAVTAAPILRQQRAAIVAGNFGLPEHRSELLPVIDNGLRSLAAKTKGTS